MSYLGVPIFAGKEAIGVISVQSIAEENKFKDNDMRLLTTLASNVGVAIEKARLYEESQRRAREAAAIAEVGREISATLDLQTVLERIAYTPANCLRVKPVRSIYRMKVRPSAPLLRLGRMPVPFSRIPSFW